MNTRTATYEHVMIDLETMGTDPNAAIVAIGAVAFDIERGYVDPNGFYAQVSLSSATKMGGTIDPDTVMWWLKQDDAARKELSARPGEHIVDTLEELSAWMTFHTANPKVWGNGASFDNVILRAAYDRAGMRAPWDWWNDRCYRTAKALNLRIIFERFGTHHHALHDARTQAEHLIRMMGPVAE